MESRERRRLERKRAQRKQRFFFIAFVIVLVAVVVFLLTHGKTAEDPPVVDHLTTEEEKMLAEIETSGDYPADLVETAQKFPETIRFVYHYHHEDTDVPRPAEGGRVPHYLQWDTRWGYKPYCESFFASAGCGPTAMAMAIHGVREDATVMPYDIAERAEALGYAIPDVGTDVALFADVAPEYEVTCMAIRHDKSTWKRILKDGGTIILNVGPGDFTNYGHFIVLAEYTDGKFLVHDPNSIKRSKLWSYETLERQTKFAWAINRD